MVLIVRRRAVSAGMGSADRSASMIRLRRLPGRRLPDKCVVVLNLEPTLGPIRIWRVCVLLHVSVPSDEELELSQTFLLPNPELEVSFGSSGVVSLFSRNGTSYLLPSTSGPY